MTGSFSKKLTLWPEFGSVFFKVWQTEYEIKHLKLVLFQNTLKKQKTTKNLQRLMGQGTEEKKIY